MADVVVFDGECNLCAHSVSFVLRHERGRTLRFAPLQSSAGSRLMRERGMTPGDARTFVLIRGDATFIKSDAALRVLAYLAWPWRLLGVLAVIPRPIRDGGYDLVARNRHRWFGRPVACVVPTPEIRARFLEQ